jgi:hypothetical protein
LKVSSSTEATRAATTTRGASEQRTGREGTLEVYGRTDAGRRLLVVVVDEGRGVCFVVTARDMTDSERRLDEKRIKR